MLFNVFYFRIALPLSQKSGIFENIFCFTLDSDYLLHLLPPADIYLHIAL